MTHTLKSKEKYVKTPPAWPVQASQCASQFICFIHIGNVGQVMVLGCKNEQECSGLPFHKAGSGERQLNTVLQGET